MAATTKTCIMPFDLLNGFYNKWIPQGSLAFPKSKVDDFAGPTKRCPFWSSKKGKLEPRFHRMRFHCSLVCNLEPLLKPFRGPQPCLWKPKLCTLPRDPQKKAMGQKKNRGHGPFFLRTGDHGSARVDPSSLPVSHGSAKFCCVMTPLFFQGSWRLHNHQSSNAELIWPNKPYSVDPRKAL